MRILLTVYVIQTVYQNYGLTAGFFPVSAKLFKLAVESAQELLTIKPAGTVSHNDAGPIELNSHVMQKAYRFSS